MPTIRGLRGQEPFCGGPPLNYGQVIITTDQMLSLLDLWDLWTDGPNGTDGDAELQQVGRGSTATRFNFPLDNLRRGGLPSAFD